MTTAERVTALEAYERDHPCPRLPQGTMSPDVVKVFQHAIFTWVLNHPLLAQEDGRRFAVGNDAYWCNHATTDQLALLGTLIPDHA